VFSLFGGKRELFLAAVERCFDRVGDVFRRAAQDFDPASAKPGDDVMAAMGRAYIEMLGSRREYLMLQHQAYAACDDEVIRTSVRAAYARLVELVEELSGESAERLDQFFSYGMWLNVAAAMGVEDLSASCEWMTAQRAAAEISAVAAD
jgi:AcrR family transcriptional regulator